MDYENFVKSTEEINNLHNVNYLETKDLNDFNWKSAYYICKEIYDKQQINKDGYTVIGLSGGRTPIDVYKNMCLIKDINIDKSKLIFFIIDERYKSDDHKFSNYNNIKFLFHNLNINENEQLYKPDTTKSIVDCILDYNEKIKIMIEKYKKVDIAILGMGSDFHIASLFPNIFYNIYMNNYQNNYIYNENTLDIINNDQDNDNLKYLKEYVYFTTTNQFDVRKRITVSLNLLANASSKIFLLNSKDKLDLWKNMLIKSYIEVNYNLYPATYLIDTSCNKQNLHSNNNNNNNNNNKDNIMDHNKFNNHKNKNNYHYSNTTVISCGYENYTKCIEEIYDSKNALSLYSNSLNKEELLTIIIFGCSGDLAKKKIYPALFKLFCNNLLPKDLLIIGFARTVQDFETFFDKIVIYLKRCLLCYEDWCISKKKDLLNGFKNRCRYFVGNYSSSESFENFNKYLTTIEEEEAKKKYYATCYKMNGSDYNISNNIQEDNIITDNENKRNEYFQMCTPKNCPDNVFSSNYNFPYVINRMLYLALPPHIFVSTLKNYKKNCLNCKGTDKILLEKPFGNDLDSFKMLSKQILENFNEEQIYRIDHYLGKDMVSGLLKLKFTNTFLLSLMNRHFIKCIKITLKETKGVYGRGQYFDPYGIIRDVMQNHMLQLLTLITMEDPIDLNDESVKNEKIKILKSIPSIKLEDTIIGQYEKAQNYKEDENNDDESKKNHSYHDDPHIDKNSITPTFCTCILYINSINWYGVPIIFKSGKGLNKDICEIRIQFHNIMGSSDENMNNNEFVIILQPVEAIYLKMMIKKTGSEEMEEVQLNLTVNEKNKKINVPEAYETLLLECFKGHKKKFISDEELYESWRIFTPLLNELQEKQVKPLKYSFGSSGPKEVFGLVKKYYNYGKNYTHRPDFVRKSSFYEDDLLDIN